ncbi:MAG: hypothetical protein H0V18_03600 [Pyrinomonadaceae bacterium]|nr:hypothetical protein [Pyrinomonadaceae bacterium]
MPFTKRQRIALTLVIAAGLLFASLFLLSHHCPASGIAFTKERRDLHLLKNRTTLPQPSDFDERLTLTSLLQPGNDSARWSTSRAARIEGYVVSVAAARTELANCYCGRDTHIHIAMRPDAPSSEHVVLETTPRIEAWARTQGWDWSEETLKRKLLGRLVLFEGWLLFDSGHAMESENIAPGTPHNWRATAWEIHPVTKIEVLK